jgi:hypothetical protein
VAVRDDGERKRLLDRASRITTVDETDGPPRSDAIDGVFTHLIQSHGNLEEARRGP